MGFSDMEPFSSDSSFLLVSDDACSPIRRKNGHCPKGSCDLQGHHVGVQPLQNVERLSRRWNVPGASPTPGSRRMCRCATDTAPNRTTAEPGIGDPPVQIRIVYDVVAGHIRHLHAQRFSESQHSRDDSPSRHAPYPSGTPTRDSRCLHSPIHL